METKYEIEIHYNQQKIKQVLTILSVLAVLSIVAFILGTIFWDEYTSVDYSTSLRGKQKASVNGWPVWACMIGKYLGIVSTISLLFVYFKGKNKEAVLALNKDGLYINMNGIKDTFLTWKEIARIEKVVPPSGGVALSIFFADNLKIIENATGIQKTMLKENLKDGKPFKIEGNLFVGDFNEFHNKAITYSK